MRYINAKETIRLVYEIRDAMVEVNDQSTDEIIEDVIDSVVRLLGSVHDEVDVVQCGECVYYVNGCCTENRRILPVLHDKDDYCKKGTETL